MDDFIRCTCEEAIALLQLGKVRGIFWVSDDANSAYPDRNVNLGGGRKSQFALAACNHQKGRAQPRHPRTPG